MKGIINTLSNNADDMVGIYFATGSTTEGTHWSGITGSRSDNANHWGTQLNFYTHNNDVANLNDATQKMVIKGDGNVGIGTTSPDSILHVNGYRLRLGDGASDSKLWGTPATGGNFLIGQSSSTGKIKFVSSADADLMTILNDGKVGINNTAPASKLNVNGNDNGSAEYSVTLGSTTTAGGTANNASSTPVNKTLLTGYSIPYSGQTNSRLTTCGFLEFASTAGWTGSQRTWAITSGYDIGGQDSGAGGNKMAIILGNAQNVSPQIGTNGAIGESGDGDGANSLVACYWDNALNMRLADSGRLYTGGGGSAALPMITPGTDKNTGIWYPTSDTWALSTAGEERMRIDSSGNVGIGTTGPSAKMHVVNNSTSVDTAIFESSASSSHDCVVAIKSPRDSYLIFQPANTNKWAIIADYPSTGDFDIYNYPNNFDSMTFKDNKNIITNMSGGNFGIGTTGPSYKLDVNGTIRATGDVIAYSDERVKENIKTIDNSLEKVNKLRGVEFNKKGEDKKSIGVIAQEIEKILPEVVSTDDNGMKSVAYGNITGVLIEAIKELKAEIEELKKHSCDCKK